MLDTALLDPYTLLLEHQHVQIPASSFDSGTSMSGSSGRSIYFSTCSSRKTAGGLNLLAGASSAGTGGSLNFMAENGKTGGGYIVLKAGTSFGTGVTGLSIA